MPDKAKKSKKQPNILVIWGDDIGINNLSCYTHGVMGYKTPNIDRLAKEGMMFTDSYGEQSCTAGRASFITRQSGYRMGLRRVLRQPLSPQRRRRPGRPRLSEGSKCYMVMAAQAVVTPFLATFKDFPPRQKAASFTIDQALEAMAAVGGGGKAAKGA